MSLQIRKAVPADVPLILEFIKALADYERLPHEAVVTQADIEATLFSERPSAEVLLADWLGEPAGFAIFFHNYSTFLGKPGLYLEDLFVKPELRALGIGKALLRRLAKIATDRNCGRMEWWVLDWNEPSIAFYRSLGAEAMSDWTVYRLTGDSLRNLAAQDTQT